jgi:hypothetical protein
MEVGSFFLSQKKLSRFSVGGSMVATKKSINRLKLKKWDRSVILIIGPQPYFLLVVTPNIFAVT